MASRSEVVATARPGDLPALSYGRARSKGLRARAAVVPFGWTEGTPPDIAYTPVFEDIAALLEQEGIDFFFTETLDFGQGYRVIDEIRREDPDLIICLGLGHHQASDVISAIWPFRQQVPILLWAYPPYEAGGRTWNTAGFMDAYVSKGTLEELGLPFFFLWELVNAPRVRERIRRYARVAVAKRRLQITRLGMFGYVAYGMYTAMMDPSTLLKRIGPEVLVYDQLTLVERMKTVPEAEALQYAREAVMGWNIDPGVTDDHLIGLGRMTLALREFAVADQLDAMTIKCHLELSHDYGYAPCLPLSLLGEEIDTVCESDLPQLVTQTMQRYLTGLVTVHADLQDVADSRVACGGCGLCPMSLCDRPAIAPWSQFYGGLQNTAPWKQGRVTLSRLGRLPDENGYRMHLAGGQVVEGGAIPGEVYGTSTVAGGWIQLDAELEEFMDTAFGNHVSLVWTDCMEEMKELCKHLSIPVTVT